MHYDVLASYRGVDRTAARPWTKKGIAKAHRHSEPYFSLALRGPLIERALEDEPASLSVLGELAESVLHYSDVISLFRLFLR